MTVHISKKVHKGVVHAFEPIPQNFDILQRIVKKKNLTNVKLYQCALGETEGNLEMVLPVVGAVKMQGLSHVVHDSITEFNEGEITSVDCKVLDKLFPTEKIDAIKIDVENFEFFVLNGGRKLLERFHPVIYIELWENENRNKCFQLFEELGYEIKVVENNSLVSYNPSNHKQQNFIVTLPTVS